MVILRLDMDMSCHQPACILLHDMSAGCSSCIWTFEFVSVMSSIDWRWLFALDLVLVLVLLNLLWVEEGYVFRCVCWKVMKVIWYDVCGRGHGMDMTDNKMENIQETRPTEEDTEGSSSSGGQLMSELRIRLEDGNVVTHTFPACKYIWTLLID